MVFTSFQTQGKVFQRRLPMDITTQYGLLPLYQVWIFCTNKSGSVCNLTLAIVFKLLLTLSSGHEWCVCIDIEVAKSSSTSMSMCGCIWNKINNVFVCGFVDIIGEFIMTTSHNRLLYGRESILTEATFVSIITFTVLSSKNRLVSPVVNVS